jgi:hypothetical protein
MPSPLELLCTKTTTSTLQLEVHLQVKDGAPQQWMLNKPVHRRALCK